MFDILIEFPGAGKVVRTVYAVDSDRDAFLIANFLGRFKWVPMDECRLYVPEEEE